MDLTKNSKTNQLITVIFFALMACTLLTLFGPYQWFFSLFEHFRWHYAWGFAVLIIFFMVSKKWTQFSLSVVFLFINLFFILNWHNPNTQLVGHKEKIFIHNIHFFNDNYNPFGNKNIKQADKVFIIENSELNINQIKENLKDFPYKIEIKNTLAFNFAVFSKTELNLLEKYEDEEVVAYLHFISDGVHYFLVHLPPPMNASFSQLQKESFQKIINQVRNLNAPWVITGDFNMTPWSHLFIKARPELNNSFFSWDQIKYFGSWPTFIPPLFKIPIDHVISNQNFEFEYGDTYGSDHRSMFVSI